ncbi:MAG: hypothetical protein ACTSXL_00980 [Alphaproteobacteria bacterium]
MFYEITSNGYCLAAGVFCFFCSEAAKKTSKTADDQADVICLFFFQFCLKIIFVAKKSPCFLSTVEKSINSLKICFTAKKSHCLLSTVEKKSTRKNPICSEKIALFLVDR